MKTEITYPTSEALVAPSKSAVGVQATPTGRILFIDNIRIFLTILVVLHHLMVTYAGTGGWIYQEGRQDMVTTALGAWFTSVNHAYFMGLFLLISAYFVPGSYERKGAAQFLKDRLIRLGIPLAVYSWILRPLFIYTKLVIYGGLQLSLPAWYARQYFQDYGLIGGGPLWFIEALLVFSALYVLWRQLVPARRSEPGKAIPFPSNVSIAFFAILIAVGSFIVRLWFPADAVFQPLNLQLADFPQYIALFIAGLVAYRNNWFISMPETTGRRWLVIAITFILLYPPLAILAGAINDDTPFKGGWHWQALLTAIWQSFLCLGMCLSVLHLFRRRFALQGAVGRLLSRNAYTVYLIHEPVITFLALGLVGVTLYPLLKFGLAAVLALPLCLAISELIRRLPYTRRVLG